MKKTPNIFVGNWRITEMESWDADYFDMEVPAHVTIRKDLTGAIRRYMAERYARGELNQIVK